MSTTAKITIIKNIINLSNLYFTKHSNNPKNNHNLHQYCKIRVSIETLS